MSADDFDPNKATEAMDAMSRTIAALGVETVRNMVSLRVLVIGMRGVGVEAAKNIALGRVAALTVYDPETVEVADLGTNFYLKQRHVGKASRAEASLEELGGLNPYVRVSAHAGELTPEFLRSFGVVIVTADLPRQELVRINQVCRSNAPRPTAFVLAQTRGAAATFFSDFGDAHLVKDANGEAVRSLVVEHFDPQTGRVKLTKPHGFDDGDAVTFAEVEGGEALEGLNGLPRVTVNRIYGKVSRKNPRTGKQETATVQHFDTFELRLDSVNEALRAAGRPELASLKDLGEWRNGGIVTEVKPHSKMAFRPLEESLRNPCVREQDRQLGVYHPSQERWMPEAFGGKGMGSQLHFAMLAMLEFRARRGQAPGLHSKADADEVVAIAKEVLEAHKAAPDGEALLVEAINEDVVRKAALYARVELTGYCAFLGGIVAQEITKIFGTGTPQYQWMHCDHFELLADEVPADAAPRGCRYDHQISVFGAAVQERLENQRWFLIGCGALGCEYLKTIALLGLGTGPRGEVHVTDLDQIELSNLSRQFLFRNRHIGKPKSVCGAEAARDFNADLRIKVHEMKVAPDTEDYFPDSFWQSLDGVWNALDNIKARKYVDGQCLLFRKPLLESGTQGTSANSEIIVPGETTSYSDHPDQETGGIAACTLRNFPSLPVHCAEWAKPLFETLFALAPGNVNKLLEDREAFLGEVAREGGDAAQVATLSEVRALLEGAKERSFEACVRLAHTVFSREFYARIKDLTHHFPADARVVDPATKADLGPFWTGAKRFPSPAEYDAADAVHASFLECGAFLYAGMLGIEAPADLGAAVRAAKLEAPAWKPPTTGPELDGEEIATNAEEEVKDDSEAQLAELVAWVKALDTGALKPLAVADFEKDDDSNRHIDFITAATNLRARNYRIKEMTRHKVKVTVGRIIPALASTTACITGMVSLEFYKVLLGFGREKLINSNPNLALGTYSWFEPTAPIQHKAREEVVDEDTGEKERIVAVPDGYSSWDHVEVRGSKTETVEEFVARLPEAHHGVKARLLFKAGLSQADIDGGKARPIFAGSARRQATMAENMLKRDNLSDAMRARFQAQVDAANKYNSELEARLKAPLYKLFVDAYGPPSVDEARKFMLLDGDFENAEGETAEIPVIRYTFEA